MNAMKLLAAEEKHLSGFFLRVVNFHERWLRRALERPRLLALFSAALIVVSYVCYNFSGSDLLPEMDEGGFVLDYIMPAGSSLAETNRVVSHIEQMLREHSRSGEHFAAHGTATWAGRRHRSQYGDILVKLKAKRDRGIDEIMADVRAQIAAAGTGRRCRVHTGSAGHDRRPDLRSGTDPDQAVFARSETTGRLGAQGG